jgi:hypothetical protein
VHWALQRTSGRQGLTAQIIRLAPPFVMIIA